MPAGAQLVAFVPTRDLARAEAFYGDVLGLRLVESSQFANEYDAHGTRLRVTLVQNLQPASHTVVGFRLTDIAAAISDLAARGVEFQRYELEGQSDDGVWTAPSGSRIAWFKDHDGNLLSLEEPTPPAA